MKTGSTVAIVCGTALLIAAAVGVIMSRNRRQPLPPPEAPVAASPAEVRVRAVEQKGEPIAQGAVAAASGAIAIICGTDEATADRYEARNDALRSIARRRNLPKNDVAALMAYLAGTNDSLRVERVAALKNDVMNLLRFQEPVPENLAGTLIGMFNGGRHPPVVLDYCIQHLGAMLDEVDEATRLRVREVLVRAACMTKQPYAGTALYSLADDKMATPAQGAELRRMAIALCAPEANNAARIAAIQLAGQMGYAEALPILRETLAGSRRDVVLDIVCIGSLGLLGNESDIPLVSRFSGRGGRFAVAVESAIKRIEGER